MTAYSDLDAENATLREHYGADMQRDMMVLLASMPHGPPLTRWEKIWGRASGRWLSARKWMAEKILRVDIRRDFEDDS